MAGKKGFDIKALFANHIEKIGFGLIALMVFGIWSSEFFGGSWSRTKENPEAILSSIEKAKAAIDVSKWPEDKRAEYPLVDFSEQSATLLRPIDSAKYDLSTEYFVPLNRPKEKAREPEIIAVESLTALPGHVILALTPDEEDLEGLDGEAPAEEATPDMDEEEMDEFARRDQGLGGDLDGPVGGPDLKNEALAANPARAKRSAAGRSIKALGPGAQETGGRALAGQVDADKALGGGGSKNFRTISGQKPQGRFFVSVRGVWPIKLQQEKIRSALHLPSTTAALDFLEILDFELERQQASEGEDPWTKPWEKLNILYAKQILDEVDGFDDEPSDMSVFDTVITMPLPMRMFGVWRDHALHPRIKNYILTPEQEQRQKAWQAKVREAYEQMELEAEKARGPERRGFDSQSVDFRVMANSMNRQNPRGAAQAWQDMSRDVRGMAPAGAAAAQVGADMSAKITAVGNLLLFRYFDFDVQPGYAYRYRVKLQLMNPNYERPVNEVMDPAYAEGESRWSPPSNISNAAVLPTTPSVFLKEVEKNPLADEGRTKQSVAAVSIYEWHRQMGTQVYDVLPQRSLGQFLGGTAKTQVLNVAEPSLDEDVYDFATEDVLLDVTGDADVLPEDHPLLKLPERRKGSKTVAMKLAPEAMIVNGGGELRQLESGGESAAEQKLKGLAERERKPFKGLKKKEETDSPLDFMGKGEIYAEGAKGGKGAKGIKGGPNAEGRPGMGEANPRRKGAGKSKGAAGAGAMPMPPGGAMPPAGGPAAGKAKGKGKAR